MSLHAGQEKEISQVQIIIAKVTLERAQYVGKVNEVLNEYKKELTQRQKTMRCHSCPYSIVLHLTS